jgi:LCP family protein required for cell wall assembly
MQPAHEASPRGRSGFVAAFLSLLFPGLGQLYLGAGRRALGWAAAVLLPGALAAGIAIRLDTFDLAGLVVQDWFLSGVLVVDLVLLVYRAAAIVDAWRIARWLDRTARAEPENGAPRPRRPRPAGDPLALLSAAGLAAVVLVASLPHLAVARYDLLVAGTAGCIFEPDREDCRPTASADPSVIVDPSASVGGSPAPSPVGSAVVEPSVPPWDGTARLNILLIGADVQGGGHNTDTLITVSIDPATGRVAMFSLPRDTVDVPIPEGPARRVFGRTYAGKINSFFVNVRNRADLFPGGETTRGYNGLKAVLGELYGLDIQYFVEVDFAGFVAIVDALGGVTVNVQVPVLDDTYPTGEGRLQRVYIPTGPQHMTGAQALVYARSRHGSSDFDRGARQQRVLLSLRNQLDIGRVLPRIDALAAALARSIRTDIPRELLPQLLGLAERVDSRAIRSFVFAPPYFGTERTEADRGYVIIPRLDRIRAAVAAAFETDPGEAARREAIAAEGARVFVLDGARDAGQAADLAAYLEFLGMTASAPAVRPDVSGLKATTIRVYNGAEARLPLTVAALEEVLGVTVELVANPTAIVDVLIITGTATPELTPPPLP